MTRFEIEKIVLYGVVILNFILYVYIKRIGEHNGASKLIEYLLFFLFMFSYYVYIMTRAFFGKYAIIAFFFLMTLTNVWFYYSKMGNEIPMILK